jgi:murein L,D-transpeptidase YafK
MGKLIFKFFFPVVLFFGTGIFAIAQTSSGGTSFTSFIDYQKSLPRPGDALKRKEDTLQKQFEAKGLKWPAKYIYIRSFKYDSQLEVWVKNDRKEKYKLFKTYKVCVLAGTLGPKRMEGDYQVPEGFYYINEFNAKSNYHLSLGLNYPNISDLILSDSLQPGGGIYIHGSCVSVGCIPLTDTYIEELYTLTAHAKSEGQDFIPVHIFPVRFDNSRSVFFLDKLTKDDNNLKKFSKRLEDVFYYFEKYHEPPVIMVNEKGEYVMDASVKTGKLDVKETKVAKQSTAVRRTRKITDIADIVHQWPEYPGGGTAFLDYLNNLGKEMVDMLPAKTKKAYVQVEFVVDKDGVPVNFTVLKGVDGDFDDELITRLEKMQNWKPALLHDKPVAKKIKQSFTIEQ